MEHEIPFPNPVQRTDLPVRRRRWPKILIALGLLLVLLIALLPQLLRTGLGRTLAKVYLERKTGLKVASLAEIRTSWFGDTHIRGLWLKDDRAVRLGFAELDCQASLWKILRGDYSLGTTTIGGWRVDYVVDYGDGASLLSRMTGRIRWPGTPPLPPAILPRLSGQIQLKNGALLFTRGEVASRNNYYVTEYRSYGFEQVNGSVEIRALDRPWHCELTGTVPDKGPPRPQKSTLKFSATLDLGENGRAVAASASMDAQLDIHDIPDPAGTVGWLIWPSLPPEDYQQLFGSAYSRITAKASLGDSKITFQDLQVFGEASDGQVAGQLTGRPIIDLGNDPPMIALAPEGAKLSARASAALARGYLSYINPFLADMPPGAGTVEITLDKTWVPLWGRSPDTWILGKLTLHDGQLRSDEWPAAGLPRPLTGQWMAVTNHPQLAPTVQLEAASFVAGEQKVKVAPHNMSIDGRKVVLGGEVLFTGAIRMTAEMTLLPEVWALLPEPKDRLTLPLAGTLESPSLQLSASGLPAPAHQKLMELVGAYVAAQRQEALRREVQRRMSPGLGTSRP